MTAATGRTVAPSNTVVKGLNALCGMRVAYARSSSVKFGDAARGCLAQQERTRLTHFFRDIQNSGKNLPRNPKPGEISSVGVEKARLQKRHGKSKNYVGDTHVYVIREDKTGSVYKIGERMRGVDRDGQSNRAQ